MKQTLKKNIKDKIDELLFAARSFKYRRLMSELTQAKVANSYIGLGLQSEGGFLCSRMGRVEARCLGENYFERSKFSALTLKQAHVNAGIFPVDTRSLSSFAKIYLDSLRCVDILGLWLSEYQGRIVSSLIEPALLTSLHAIEPHHYESPWTNSMRGKRLLVVHPFVDTIRLQADRSALSNLFGGKNLHVYTDLQLLRPPFTLGGMTDGCQSWDQALEIFLAKIDLTSFDVAWVGAGSYGLPIGAYLKRNGKKVIHLGGYLQYLFGIQGGRWDSWPSYAANYNQYWVRPLESDSPPIKAVENACYW